MSSDVESEIASKLAVNVLTEIFKTCFQGLADAKRWVSGKSTQYDPFGKAAADYAEHFERRYGTVRIFGMHEPVPLRQLYVSVNVLTAVTAYRQASIKDLESYLRYEQHSFGCISERKSALSAVRSHRRLIVLGKPGAGKTTFLKHTALYALQNKLDVHRVPVFVSLKDWSDSGKSLHEYITQQFDICAFPNAELFIEHLLGSGNALVLLDGLDEVTADPEGAVKILRDFTDKYDKNQYILSCRIAAYNYVFSAFTEVEVADFDDSQIQRFVTNWFSSQNGKAVACWQALENDPATKELASLPLLLALLCLAFDEAMEFSANRAELYHEAVDALLKKWDSSRAIKRDSTYKRLTLKEKEAMLSRIAMRSFDAEKYFLHRKQITEYIEEYLQHLLPPGQGSEIDADTVLRSVIAQHGLFFERAKNIFSFLHLTFHEYFTARYIVEHQRHRTVERLMESHWKQARWREVILLTAGMMAEADALIWCLIEKVNHFSTTQAYHRCVTLLAVLPSLAEPQKVKILPEDSMRDAWIALEWIQNSRLRHSHFTSRRDSGVSFVMARIVGFHRGTATGIVPTSLEGAFGVGDLAEETNEFTTYAYAVDLIHQCLASGAFISKTLRSTLTDDLSFWDNLLSSPQTVAGYIHWLRDSD